MNIYINQSVKMNISSFEKNKMVGYKYNVRMNFLIGKLSR